MGLLREFDGVVDRQLAQASAVNVTISNNSGIYIANSNSTFTDNENGPFLTMLTVMISFISLFFMICMYQVLRIWICKRAPLGVPVEETVLVHEGRIFNLTGDQRRAVLESIFSENSKSITEQELKDTKKKRRLERKARNGDDNNITTTVSEEETDALDNDEVPVDVEVPNICIDHTGCNEVNDMRDNISRTRKHTGSNDYNPSINLDDDFEDGDDRIPISDDTYLVEPPGDSPYAQYYNFTSPSNGNSIRSYTNVETLTKERDASKCINVMEKGSDNVHTHSSFETFDDDIDVIRTQLSYDSCMSGSTSRHHNVFRVNHCNRQQQQLCSRTKRRHSTGSILANVTKTDRLIMLDSKGDDLTVSSGFASCKLRSIKSTTILVTDETLRKEVEVARPVTSTLQIENLNSCHATNKQSTPPRNNLATNNTISTIPIISQQDDDIHLYNLLDYESVPSFFYEVDHKVSTTLVVPSLSKTVAIMDPTEAKSHSAINSRVSFSRSFTFPAYSVDPVDEGSESAISFQSIEGPSFRDLTKIESTSSRKKRAKSYTIPENQPIVEDNNLKNVNNELADEYVSSNNINRASKIQKLAHQLPLKSMVEDLEEDESEVQPVVAKIGDAYGGSFDEDDLLRNSLHLPIALQSHESYSTATSEYTYDDDSMSGENVCSICLCGYKKGDILVVSKHCTHVFHKDCILEWLENHDKCPICRVGMVTDSELSKAATSLVGKTRMYRAVASMQASPSTQMRIRLHQSSNSNVQHHQQQWNTTRDDSNNNHAIHRTPPHSPYGGRRMGAASNPRS